MADTAKELRRAVDTGSVVFGFNQSRKTILKGQCQLVVASRNAERYSKEKVEQLCKRASVPFYQSNLTGLQLGSVCGKPFVISFACVLKPGKSKILDAAKPGKTG